MFQGKLARGKNVDNLYYEGCIPSRFSKYVIMIYNCKQKNVSFIMSDFFIYVSEVDSVFVCLGWVR
jgi:hypothetical protein